MNTIHARNVVLGAGAMGSAAAYHLAKRGEPLLLIEQFQHGHGRGSSHGLARITRHSYADPTYANLMPEAFRAWKTLEADAGQNLFLRTGGVSIGPAGSDYVAKVAANLKAIEIPHRTFSGRELNRRYNTFGVADDAEVVFEPDAGMLAASRALRLQVELARQFGGDNTRIMEDTTVLRIDLDADKPTLETIAARIVADRLIVTAGAWTSRLFPKFSMTLKPTRQQVLYFRPDDPQAYFPGRFPVFIVKGLGPPDDVYGMPVFEGLGVKVARHGGPEADPGRPETEVAQPYRDEMRSFLKRLIPGLAASPIDKTEVCLYTVTPDDHFQVGLLPSRSDIIVASPCSGHGFKFSCLIGRILADLAIEGETDQAIEPWRLVMH